MSYPAMLGRRLNLPVLNLGFDGNGKAEPEVAELLGTLSPAIYVIDCLPNLMPAEASKVEALWRRFARRALDPDLVRRTCITPTAF
jgi:hypothetical protein